jgi:hypothetical protein
LGRLLLGFQHGLTHVAHGEEDYYSRIQGQDKKDHQDEFGLQGSEHKILTAWTLPVRVGKERI